MANRIEVEIPAALVADYQDGRTTVADLALRLGTSQHAVRRKLRSLGVDTSPRTRKRLTFAHQVEEAQHLAPGTAYATVVELYRQGYGTQKIGHQLHMTPRKAASPSNSSFTSACHRACQLAWPCSASSSPTRRTGRASSAAGR